jgi:hypothetical protein
MLDPKVVELTDRLIQTQYAERRQQLACEIHSAAQQFNSRGTLHSSMHLQKVTEICHHEVEIRAWIVHNAHVRVLSQLGADHYPELAGDLKGRLAYYLPLQDDYAQAPKELAHRIGLQSHPDIRIHETRDHVLTKIGTEIDLFVETLIRQGQQRTEQAAGNPVYNINAPIGAFQTGPGSMATVVQHIGTEDKETLLLALSLVRDALSQLPDTAGFPRADIIELVNDADAEIKKPAPNRTKLSSVLTTIGNSIQTLGTLQSAYQTLKGALLPFGITLP